MTVPFSEGELSLGTGQHIVLCEFDVRPRSRKVVVQVVSD
ncbi:MAG: YjbQ family protein [Nitrososphaerales archaeon]